MTILLPVALVIVGLMIWGFIVSREQRGIDRRHFAAFVGFSAAVIAVTATTLELVVADLHPHSMSPAWGGFLFLNGIIAIVSIAVTFFAGLFSRGTQRFALVSCGIVVALMYLGGLVSHFGD
jgi:hypothetical protein